MTHKDFIVDQARLRDAVTALHDFVWSVCNEDGSPVRLPLFVTPDWIREQIAGLVTGLRYQGEAMYAKEQADKAMQLQALDKVNGEKHVFKHTIERVQ